jgi:hypothetical protein
MNATLAEKLAKLQSKVAPAIPKYYPLVPIPVRERVSVPSWFVRFSKIVAKNAATQWELYKLDQESKAIAEEMYTDISYADTPEPRLVEVTPLELVREPKQQVLSTAQKLALLGLAHLLGKQEKKVEVQLPTHVVNNYINNTYVENFHVHVPSPAPELREVSGEVLPKQDAIPQLKKHEVRLENLNPEQLLAVEYARRGISFCLVGGAGYGKTTTTQIIAKTLAESGLIHALGYSTKKLASNAPSIVFVSFTNPAVSNIKSAVPEEYKNNCLTIHSLTEFEPTYYPHPDDPERMTMKFEPQRTSINPIVGITHVVGEESGTINLDLADTLTNAIEGNPVYIWLGDLQQLPPAFGDGILGYKLLELPVIELKVPYRTDADSPIKKLAFRIQEGFPIRDQELDSIAKSGELEIWRYPKLMDEETTIQAMGQHFRRLVLEGEFNPLEDVLLIPYNKLVGTIELGKWIAQAQNEKAKERVHEILAGIHKFYFAVGDLVYHNKRKCKIVDITNNGQYVGPLPEPSSLTLDRWGIDRQGLTGEALARKLAENKTRMESMFELTMEGAASDASESPTKRQASHVITLEGMEDDLPSITVQTVGDISGMYFAHTLTVYKAQGSEWNKVFCLFHQCHKAQLNRETLYTAITRARKYLKLYVLGEKTTTKFTKATFYQGMMNQRIPGNTLEEKLKYFRKKLATEALAMELDTGEKIGMIDENLGKDDMKALIKKLMAYKKMQKMMTMDEEGV